MKKLLITGGAGFIGGNFVHYWRKQYPDDLCVVLDALTYAGNKATLDSVKDDPKVVFVHGNIGDQPLVESLLRDHGIDTIVHFAAESHVDRSILGPDAFIETNVLGTHSLLKAARKVWLDEQANPNHRFHHVSTDEVYGSLTADDPAFTETTPYAPNSPYSASKAASDHLVRAYHHTYGLNVTTSNCSNNYGPFHFPEKLIPLCILNILHGKALPIYGDGKNVRDWLYVEDHCRGIEKIIHNGQVGEVYNVGGCNEWTNIDIVNLICELVDNAFAKDSSLAERFPDSPAKDSDSASLIEFVTDRPGHDHRYAIDACKIETDLGFKPQETFETGIRKTLQWYLTEEKWWQDILSGAYQQWIETQYQ